MPIPHRSALQLISVVALVAAVPAQSPAHDDHSHADAPAAAESKHETARGVVFHDANNNRTLEAGEKPLAGVRVSNGRDIVTTGDDGRYELSVTGDANLFVLKPRSWQAPLSEDNLPQFYYIHKPHGSPPLRYTGVAPTGPLPESVDFPLYPQREPDQFKAILFGDPQPRNLKEVEYVAHDVVEELIGTDASFGVTLGDAEPGDRRPRHPLVQRHRQPRPQLRRPGR
jgi:hypothetical protein